MSSKRAGGKPISDLNAELQHWLDIQPMTSTCTHDGCGRVFTGPTALVLAAAEAHRREAHPGLAEQARRNRQQRLEQIRLEKLDRYKPTPTRPRQHPLGPAQNAILQRLDAGPQRLHELAEWRGVAYGAMLKTLHSLVNRELVVRISRGVYAIATPTPSASTVEAA